jgi:hypothetical protein
LLNCSVKTFKDMEKRKVSARCFKKLLAKCKTGAIPYFIGGWCVNLGLDEFHPVIHLCPLYKALVPRLNCTRRR